MVRTSPCYYISPSAISISPNANGSASDLAVNVVKGAKIKVYSKGVQALGWSDSVFQQWTLTGRNRRLADSTKPYTIYARLNKNNKSDGYLVFAPKEADKDGNWLDKYAYVTIRGLATGTVNKNVSDYWYVKLGEVSLPTDNVRTVTLDTGILGTDQFNTEWNLHPDDMPLRVELSATIDLKDAGSKPYVPWGKKLVLQAKLLQGWADTTIPRFHHFTIQRNTGDTDADKTYNYPDGNSEVESSGRQMSGGNIILSHARGEGDVFNGTVSSAWTVIAWGTKATADGSVPSSSSSSSDTTETYEKLAETTTSISAETAEQFSLERSSAIANYDPSSDTYSPSDGIDVMIRAIDQKGEVFKMTNAQRKASSLTVQYCVGEEAWNTCTFTGTDTEVAKTTIPMEAFHLQQNVNVRIVRVIVTTSPAPDPSSTSSSDPASQKTTTTYKELYRTHIPLVRNGEDSKEREWIFLRSASAIQFSSDVQDTTKPLIPSLIVGGEVKPEEAATGDDTNKNQDGWVPEGWWDEMRGTDSEHHYEYAAYRDYIKGGVPDNSSSSPASSESSSDPSKSGNASQRGGHWGDFSTPRIWGYYANDAVSYRCRWTLAGVEVYQLKCAYTGAFRGTLPLVGTLLKRVGSGQEQEVTGKTVVTLKCEGTDYSKTFDTDNPTFTVNTTDANTADFVQYLNKVELSGLSVSFAVDGEEHNFSIPVIREADEDSVVSTVDKYSDDHLLRKDKDDQTEHNLRMGSAEVDTVLKSHDYDNHAGFPFGKGWAAMKDDGHGASILEVDKLFVRMKAYFAELEIRKISYLGGNYVFSSAGGTIYYVEWLGDKDKVLEKTEANKTLIKTFRCYLYSNDGTTKTMNWFQTDDQVRCQNFGDLTIAAKPANGVITATDATTHYWWRRVSGKGSGVIAAKGDNKNYEYVDFLNKENEYGIGSDFPEEGDVMVQFGNWTNAERQGVIMIVVTGDDAPAIIEWQNVGANNQHFTIPAKEYSRISPRGEGNIFRGKFISVSGTATDYTGTSIDEQIEALIKQLNDIKNQADKKFEIWFNGGDPHPNSATDKTANAPASDWTTDAEKGLHTQDLYYDTDKDPASKGGRAWRWMAHNTNGTVAYYWDEVTDKDTSDALEKAREAKESADEKVQTFVSDSNKPPTPPYKKGDFWIQTDQENNVMICIAGKSAGESYDPKDWTDLSDLVSVTDARTILATLADKVWDLVGEAYLKEGKKYVKVYIGSQPSESVYDYDLSYDKGVLYKYKGGWQKVEGSGYESTFATVLSLLGTITIRVSNYTNLTNTTPPKRYDLALMQISIQDPVDGNETKGNCEIMMYNEKGAWEVLRTCTLAIMKNYGDHIVSIVKGISGTVEKISGTYVTKDSFNAFSDKFTYDSEGNIINTKKSGLLTTTDGNLLYATSQSNTVNMLMGTTTGVGWTKDTSSDASYFSFNEAARQFEIVNYYPAFRSGFSGASHATLKSPIVRIEKNKKYIISFNVATDSKAQFSIGIRFGTASECSSNARDFTWADVKVEPDDSSTKQEGVIYRSKSDSNRYFVIIETNEANTGSNEYMQVLFINAVSSYETSTNKQVDDVTINSAWPYSSTSNQTLSSDTTISDSDTVKTTVTKLACYTGSTTEYVEETITTTESVKPVSVSVSKIQLELAVRDAIADIEPSDYKESQNAIESYIKQTADSLTLYADNIILNANHKLAVTGNYMTISTDNFTLTEDGSIYANNATINGTFTTGEGDGKITISSKNKFGSIRLSDYIDISYLGRGSSTSGDAVIINGGYGGFMSIKSKAVIDEYMTNGLHEYYTDISGMGVTTEFVDAKRAKIGRTVLSAEGDSSLTDNVKYALENNLVTYLFMSNSSDITIPMPPKPEEGNTIIVVQLGGKINFTSSYGFQCGANASTSASSDKKGQWTFFAFFNNRWQTSYFNGQPF